VRSNSEPALKFFGGATGTTCISRPPLPVCTTRSSSGVSPTTPLLERKATVPIPGNSTPAPEREPVTALELVKGMSAACTEPAADFSI
jgi:hypothetical protein